MVKRKSITFTIDEEVIRQFKNKTYSDSINKSRLVEDLIKHYLKTNKNEPRKNP